VIAGIDIGVRRVTLCLLGAHGQPSWRRLEAPSHLDALQAARALGVLAAYADWSTTSVVWVERPFGKHIRSVADLSRVVGAVLAGIPADIPVSEISPGEWKIGVGLRGNAPKLDVQRWAQDHLRAGFAGNLERVELDEHEADAYAIATACLVASRRAVELRLVRGSER
jgi:Holliday junction resolvasome RuvABC endonuclease subunit